MPVTRPIAHKIDNLLAGVMGFVCLAEEKIRRLLPDLAGALAELERAKTAIRQTTDYVNVHVAVCSCEEDSQKEKEK